MGLHGVGHDWSNLAAAAAAKCRGDPSLSGPYSEDWHVDLIHTERVMEAMGRDEAQESVTWGKKSKEGTWGTLTFKEWFEKQKYIRQSQEKLPKVEKGGKGELAEGKEVKGFQQSNEWPQCIKTAEVHEIRPETDSYTLSNKLRLLVDTVWL